jgi:hypothetical protein
VHECATPAVGSDAVVCAEMNRCAAKTSECKSSAGERDVFGAIKDIGVGWLNDKLPYRRQDGR